MMATVAFILHPQKPIWNITFPVCHNWAYTFFFQCKIRSYPNQKMHKSKCTYLAKQMCRGTYIYDNCAQNKL